jgi:hypothetical protein
MILQTILGTMSSKMATLFFCFWTCQFCKLSTSHVNSRPYPPNSLISPLQYSLLLSPSLCNYFTFKIYYILTSIEKIHTLQDHILLWKTEIWVLGQFFRGLSCNRTPMSTIGYKLTIKSYCELHLSVQLAWYSIINITAEPHRWCKGYCVLHEWGIDHELEPWSGQGYFAMGKKRLFVGYGLEFTWKIDNLQNGHVQKQKNGTIIHRKNIYSTRSHITVENRGLGFGAIFFGVCLATGHQWAYLPCLVRY